MPAESEELEPLYSSMAKVITDGLLSFEKNSTLNLSQLQCTLMILKAASTNNPSYMDRWVGQGDGGLGDGGLGMHTANRPFPHKLFGAASDSLKTSITGIRLLQQCLGP